MHFELVKNKVIVKIYNREFTKSTQNYLSSHYPLEEVKKNFELITSDLNAQNLLVAHQVHGVDIANADRGWLIGDEPKADGILTSTARQAIGIQTADCVPILLSTEDGEHIASLHCGWKSTINGIIKNCKDKFASKTDSKIIAVIGPSIQQNSYEVDKDYMENFLSKSQEYKKFFRIKSSTKYLFDLPGLVKYMLQKEDITLLKHFDEDTFLMPDKYPSNRFSFVNGLGKYKGSILSVIMKL